MREIKFRAWHKQAKRFIEWDQILKGLDEKSRHGELFVAGHEKYLSLKKDRFPSEMSNYWTFFAKDIFSNPDIQLVQFTGLKDINGKEIYESDLVNWEGDIYEVRFLNGCWELFHSGDQESDRPSLYNIIKPSRSNIEVVGNVYEKMGQA